MNPGQIKGKQEKKRPRTELPFKVAAKSLTESDVHLSAFVIQAGKKQPLTSADLENLVLRIDGDKTLVREAINMATGENLSRLERSTGVHRPDSYYLRVAMTVAAMNLDRVGADDVVAPSRSKSAQKDQLKSAQRVTSVVAAMLQEFVAHDIIKLETVASKFGKDIATLTEELSRISRIPITIRDPEPDGTMAVKDYLFNKRQHEFGQELILATDNPVRVGLIKIADALQQLRHLSHVPHADDPAVKTRAALHIQGMYLPLVHEAGIHDIQKEMQARLLHILDPQADSAIEHKLHSIDAPGKIVNIKKKIWQTLEKDNYGLDSIVAFEGRVKEPWAIWQKLLYKKFKAVEDGCKPEVEELERQRDLALQEKSSDKKAIKRDYEKRIHDVKESYQKSSDYKDAKIPVVRLGDVDMSPIHDILAFRLVFQDSFDSRGQIDRKGNHRRARTLNSIFVKARGEKGAIFPEVLGEKDDYIAHPKPNGYMSHHNVHICDGAEFEMQIRSKSMDDDSNSGLMRHASHKVTRRGHAGIGAEIHPARRAPSQGLERLEVIADILVQMAARTKGQPLPGHKERSYRIVSTKGGYLRSVKPRSTLKDLANEIHTTFLASTSGVIINGKPFVGQDYQDKLKEPLAHADYVEFLKTAELTPERDSLPQTNGKHGQTRDKTL